MTQEIELREPAPLVEESPDIALLRRHEPVLAFTQGEMFFPTGAEAYVEECSLVSINKEAVRETLVERDNLDLDALVKVAGQRSTAPLSLRFVDKPMGGLAYRRWLSTKPEFEAQGRLARSGLIGRFADAAFQLTLLLRGRVPGGTAAQAEVQYAAMRDVDPRDVYYGRVLRRHGYVVLHYLYFYAMNDWRSSFFGVNDHEADWEQVFVFLTEYTDGSVEPAWLAYSSHDLHGADLRRRWDDPELTIEDGHPVVFVGAGSHACYFKAGEYVTSVRPRFLKVVSDGMGILRRFWRDTLGQGDPRRLVGHVERAITVPYVDYARGDGLRIGPHEEREWTPVRIDDSVPWVNEYRGLWGLDTGDVLGGERAPAGPKYNRDGTVRHAWADPIGWVDLDLEVHPAFLEQELERRIHVLGHDADEIVRSAAVVRDDLAQFSVEIQGLSGVGGLKRYSAKRDTQVQEMEAALRSLTTEEADLRSAIAACERLQAQARAGYRSGPRDHVRHSHEPEPPARFREGRIAEYWAAASAGLILFFIVLAFALSAPWFTVIVLAVGGIMLVDSLLRGSATGLLLNVTIGLAIATAAILVYEFFWYIAFAAIAGAGVLILAKNLRELRPSRLSRQ